MTKPSQQSFLSFSLLIAISLLLTGGVLWCVEKEKKEINVIQTEILQQNEKAVKKVKEAIEKKRQRADKDLVWYEIPEIGVRFKVKKESLDDTKYSYEKNVTLTSNYGSETFDNISLYSKFLESNVKGCGTDLASLKKFIGKPNEYSGILWGNTEDEIAQNDMRLFDSFFIIGQFSCEVEVPHNCYVGATKKDTPDYYSIWNDKSKYLMEAFRNTLELIPTPQN